MIFVAKRYWGYVLAYKNHSQTILGVQFGYDFHSQTVPGVCFGYNFCMAKHNPRLVVRGGICLPVTPVKHSSGKTSFTNLNTFSLWISMCIDLPVTHPYWGQHVPGWQIPSINLCPAAQTGRSGPNNYWTIYKIPDKIIIFFG